MAKYKYILIFPDGRTFDSMEEYGDDDFEGTFSSYEEAEEAALYSKGCDRQGAEIMNMSNPGDYEYDEEEYEEPRYKIVQIEE